MRRKVAASMKPAPSPSRYFRNRSFQCRRETITSPPTMLPRAAAPPSRRLHVCGLREFWSKWAANIAPPAGHIQCGPSLTISAGGSHNRRAVFPRILTVGALSACFLALAPRPSSCADEQAPAPATEPAPQIQTLTLDQAVEAALRGNFDVQASRDSVQAAA